MIIPEGLVANNVIFPREDHTASNDEAATLFIKAYAMDFANDLVYGGEQTPEVARLYRTAFDAGSIEAGVNLMRILMMVGISTSQNSISCPNLKNQLADLFEKLAALSHPIVPYYRALSRIGTDEPEIGYIEMQSLVDAGNKYAITYWALNDYLAEEGTDGSFYENAADGEDL